MTEGRAYNIGSVQLRFVLPDVHGQRPGSSAQEAQDLSWRCMLPGHKRRTHCCGGDRRFAEESFSFFKFPVPSVIFAVRVSEIHSTASLQIFSHHVRRCSVPLSTHARHNLQVTTRQEDTAAQGHCTKVPNGPVTNP